MHQPSTKHPPIHFPTLSPTSLINQTHSSAKIPQHKLNKSITTNFPTQFHTPPPHQTPTTLSSLQRAIHTARIQNRRIKPTTNLFSTSTQAAFNAGAIILNTSSLNTVTRSNATVTAQCGARLTHLPLPLVPPDKSVGSAIADGALSLGGFADGLIADCLIAISLVDSTGRLRMYKRDDPTGIFQALLVSHGLCGIIYDATFITSFVQRVVRVRLSTRPIAVISRNGLRSIVNGRTAAEITWIPFNSCDGVQWHVEQDTVIVKAVESTTRELLPGRLVRYSTIPEFILKNCSALTAGGYGAFEGWHTRIILSKGYNTVNENFVTTLRDAVGEEYDRHVVHEESVCFPLNLELAQDWDRIVTAWGFVLDMVREFDTRDRYPLNMMMKLRFVGGSEGLLAVNRGTSCILTIVSAKGTANWKEFSQVIVREWEKMGGRWVVNRCGVGTVDDRVKFVKRVARNGGLDDCGMFEDFVVGMGEMRVTESLESISDVSDADVVVVEEKGEGELWWVWIYVVAYLLLWCWFFGEDAIRAIRANYCLSQKCLH